MRSVGARRYVALVGCLLTLGIMESGTAQADIGGNDPVGSAHTSGRQSGQSLESRITFTGVIARSASGGDGTMTAADNWAPPACWYEPMSAKEFAESMEKAYAEVTNDPKQPSYARAAQGQFRDIYKDGKYKNYNLDKAEDGSWWVAVQDDNRLDEPDAWDCSENPFWVERGHTPQVKNAVTPEVLAGLAYNKVRLPSTSVSLAPRNVTKVNLPTWTWLDKGKFRPVSVTASLNAGGIAIQATTTAKPVALKLEPGTNDAAIFPASGVCRINADGSIGEPYARGKANENPSCGITYLRSSSDGTFKLRATVTWAVSWTGTGGAGGELPDGTFGSTQNITVQEIQAINR